MLAAASMPIVAGSSVHSAAVRTPRAHALRCSMLAIMDVPDRDDEQAVSMLMAEPVWDTQSRNVYIRLLLHLYCPGEAAKIHQMVAP